MSRTLTFIDAGVLIHAARGNSSKSVAAFTVLDDPRREFASSVFIELEVRPKAIYNKRLLEAAYYEAFFRHVARRAAPDEDLFAHAYKMARDYGLSGADALHAASALAVGTDEFVTTKGKTKPLHRLRGIKIVSL